MIPMVLNASPLENIRNTGGRWPGATESSVAPGQIGVAAPVLQLTECRLVAESGQTSIV